MNIVPPPAVRSYGKGKIILSNCTNPSPYPPGQDYFPTWHDGLGGLLASRVLRNVEVVTIFWGDYWAGASIEATPEDLNIFLDIVLTSSLMDMISSEYSIGDNVIGHGTLKESVRVPNSWGRFSLGSSVSAGEIRQLVRELVDEAKVPYSLDTLYMVYIQKGTEVIDDHGAPSCTGGFEGYHDYDFGPLLIGGPVGQLLPLVIGVICP
ncbi:MAG: hypothetical protein ACREBW_06150, partial [Candidatus Micrarchaeaceae archaeon]